MKLLARYAKGRLCEYPHTHMGVHEDILGKGKKRSVEIRIAQPVVYPMRWRKRMTQDAVYLNEK
jgi:hypothetical protein